MKRNNVSAIVEEIARSTHHPEAIVAEMYTAVATDLKRDATIMDFVPLLAARRVRENLKLSAEAEQRARR
jgi:transcription initiation factor TFIIIB Brf1 subunit/transcription initiation factor TFIIB